MATCGKADLRKVAVIFETFDIDKDARLNSAELTKLIQQCNPKIRFSVVQLEAMVEEVLEQYEGSAQAPGLSRQSLAQLYIDGVGDCDMDFQTMQLGHESPAAVCVTDAAHQPTNQAATEIPATSATFVDLFGHSPGQTTAASPSSRDSFSFCMPAADNNENAEPNSNLRMQPQTEFPSLPTPKPLAQGSLGPAGQSPGLTAGDTEYDTAAQQAMQEQQKQHTTPRRRRGGWGTPQAAPDQQMGSSMYAANYSAAAGLANNAKQEKQEHQGCAALVDHLALAVDLGDHAWQETAAALRQRADGLDSADCYDAHMEMGTLLASRKHHKEAVTSFQHAVVAAPQDARPLFRLGNALFAIQQFHDSQEAFSQALSYASLPGDAALLPKIHVNLGISLEAEGQLELACQHYRNAFRLNPKHFRALKLLGSAMYATGDLQAACTALESALQLNPAYADAHCDLGCVRCALGQVEESKLSFADAVRHNPQHVEALFNLGNLHRQCSEYQAAVQSYDSVLRLNDKHWRSMLNKAVALIGLHQDRAAQLSLKQAYQISGRKDVLAQEVASLCRMAQSGVHPVKLQDLLKQLPDSVA